MESHRDNPSKMISKLLVLTGLLFYLVPSPVAAYQFPEEIPAKTYSFDHVINRRGESRITMLTGIPIVGTAEYAYGISDRLTAGVFGGFTPFEEAVGIRVRTVLYQKKALFRVYYCTPIVFYPQRSLVDPEPWWLIRPNINFEWLVNSGFRYKFGASMIGVATHRQVFGGGGTGDQQLSPELWTAIHGGFSLPVGKQLSFQTELSYITKGMGTITDFFGGPPMLAIVGFSYTF
ncbi:hypothetical protein G3570_14975 [Balneolaceae bacterium YR4-1]|uniref:Outer membrane protein beta-barrel domain-containing protein n=1 Tax=Halalkalibaculum roseum TaxID=2709311 RepID=A0A6M1SXY1_9BACT|nr:hypothetical protein [Halalkalibaculum roseum]NGP77950.1 hypothetical protein [Halalkalibaculum roseum]